MLVSKSTTKSKKKPDRNWNRIAWCQDLTGERSNVARSCDDGNATILELDSLSPNEAARQNANLPLSNDCEDSHLLSAPRALKPKAAALQSIFKAFGHFFAAHTGCFMASGVDNRFAKQQGKSYHNHLMLFHEKTLTGHHASAHQRSTERSTPDDSLQVL